jgi:UDP-N-acetylglucosamine 2-epimerase (non-hydrolysing)
MMCIVGARPNFMKAAPVIEALKKLFAEVSLVHTGQHYSLEMSGLFFDELKLPQPDIDLQVGSGSHAEQMGQILIRLEPWLKAKPPTLVIVFGDVNSTVAAALCAVKLGIPVAHVEAGLRSFDRSMPEELNRVVTDHVSDYLFTTERSGRENLLREGISDSKIFFVGNVMVDTLLKHLPSARKLEMCRRYGLEPGEYGILTLHRPGNVDDPRTVAEILSGVDELSRDIPILFPCHLRTRERLVRIYGDIKSRATANSIRVTDPLGYLEFLSLMCDARLVLTDSGGIQEESTVLGLPCLTIRENTERPVTIEQGSNVLVGTNPERIVAVGRQLLRSPRVHRDRPDFWDGKAADRIAAVLEQALC